MSKDSSAYHSLLRAFSQNEFLGSLAFVLSLVCASFGGPALGLWTCALDVDVLHCGAVPSALEVFGPCPALPTSALSLWLCPLLTQVGAPGVIGVGNVCIYMVTGVTLDR